MKEKISEDYVSFEVAKLLKEKGFKEWCFHCYGVAVLHNGADISFDEECELKDEGRENEIEYVEGGRLYDYGCNNRDKDAKVWAAPTLQMAMKWLRENFNMNPVPYATSIGWYFEIFDLSQRDITGCALLYDIGIPSKEYTFDTYEEACEAGIRYVLENLI